LRKTLLLVFGILSALLAVAAFIGSGVLLALFGRDGSHVTETGSVHASQGARVLVSEITGVRGTLNFSQATLRVTLGVQSLDGQPIFVGLASSQDVATWLAGVPYDRFEPSGSGYSQTSIPGALAPPPPAEQAFWTVRAQGLDPTIALDLRGRSYSLVVMRLDGSPQVAARLTLGLNSTRAFPAAVTMLVAGLVLLLVGALLTWRGLRGGGRQPRHAQGASSAVGARLAAVVADGPTAHDVVTTPEAGSGR